MQIVFLHGPAAAGKFTVGKCLSRISGLPLFHNHLTVDLVLSLFEFGSPEFIELRESIWLQTFKTAARSNRSLIFTFQPEASVSIDFVERAQRQVEANQGTIQFVELKCLDDVLEQRVSNADRAQYGKLTELALYRQIRTSGGFEYPQMPPHLIQIDTAHTAPEVAAEQIWSALCSSA